MKKSMWKTNVRLYLLSAMYQVAYGFTNMFNFMWRHKILTSFSRGMTRMFIDVEKSIVLRRREVLRKTW